MSPDTDALIQDPYNVGIGRTPLPIRPMAPGMTAEESGVDARTSTEAPDDGSGGSAACDTCNQRPRGERREDPVAAVSNGDRVRWSSTSWTVMERDGVLALLERVGPVRAIDLKAVWVDVSLIDRIMGSQ